MKGMKGRKDGEPEEEQKNHQKRWQEKSSRWSLASTLTDSESLFAEETLSSKSVALMKEKKLHQRNGATSLPSA